MSKYPLHSSPSTLHLSLKPLNGSSNDSDDLGLANNSTITNLPSIWGIPLKYISLVTLAVQNSALTIIMHHSRVSSPSSRAYSAATAVLMSEILKGLISLLIAFARIDPSSHSSPYAHESAQALSLVGRVRKLYRDIFSSDCWKLSIPAILYVIQNNLQYVAVSNLDAATFQVTYQMKILTTAAFSVLLLRKKLSSAQWLSLLFLAIGVGVVQIQDGAANTPAVSEVLRSSMNPLKGFMAVTAACFTSGLAGVYFEMVLKNSQADLWVRNVQLSLFSLLPALAPILIAQRDQHLSTSGFVSSLFDNFGVWAWATISVQVLGGLVTAMVIKYSDNILKGFATSLSIVISFLASVALFNFKLTFTFLLGSTIVLIATWLYNLHPKRPAYLSLKDSLGWNRMRSEKVKHVNSPVVVQPQFYGRLTAVSSTTSLSSLPNSRVITPPLPEMDGNDSVRINFVR